MDPRGITDAKNSETDSGRCASGIEATASITLLQLWILDSALWFTHAKNKLNMSRISSEFRKYQLFLEALPPEAMGEVHDILVLPLGKNQKDSSSPPCPAFTSRHLAAPELGGRHPTQFLHHLENLLGITADFLDTNVLHELFLQHLPPNIQLTLVSAHKSLLSEVVKLADDMMDVAPARRSLVSEVDALQERVKNLGSQVAELHRELRDTHFSNHPFCLPN
ncbi:hypothetical protein HPB49_019457 [Dermacentor silvarum]|uniref:Uncharacterized protein n=1 Tax=Dermacentor silvarum TaxID=543639 RepID=A0ACB8DR01_DERSI|nr:hypothetical protein HPB49_019457 [Dermacentor silvarum]